MTQNQLKILKVTIAAIAIALLFPPFIAPVGSGAMRGEGFGFIFYWPELCMVHVEMLLAEWLAIGLISRLIWAIDSNQIDWP